MAYARYGRKSDWYIFWEERKGRTTGRREHAVLAVWHRDHRSTAPSFTYGEVRAMLESRDFSAIPGYQAGYRDLIETALREFVNEVDDEFKNGG